MPDIHANELYLCATSGIPMLAIFEKLLHPSADQKTTFYASSNRIKAIFYAGIGQNLTRKWQNASLPFNRVITLCAARFGKDQETLFLKK